MINTKKINLAIEQGKLKGAKKLLRTQYIKEHKSKFNTKHLNDYNELFPLEREMSDKEKIKYDSDNIHELTGTYPLVTIDYSKDGSFLTFEEYINETKVIKEATEFENEVVELVRPYTEPTEDEILNFIDNFEPLKKAINSEKKSRGSIYDLNGTEYMIPFKSEDAVGLLQVKAGFELGLTETNIKFSNNTIMPISSSEFTDFSIWFTLNRSEFFV